MLGVLDDDSEGSRVHNFIGIIVAISGNIVISLALNCQKLAHKRLEAEAAQQLSRRPPSPVNTPSSKVTPRSDAQRPRDTTLLRPLRSPIAKYSSVVSSRFKGSGYDTSNRYTAIPSDDNEGSDIPQSSNAIADSISADANHFTIEEESGAAEVFSANNSPQSGEFPPPKMESNYLKSKLWCACSRSSRSLDRHYFQVAWLYSYEYRGNRELSFVWICPVSATKPARLRCP